MVRIANDSPFGLNSPVFTSDLDCEFRISRDIRTGTVNINSSSVAHPDVPFGGYKQVVSAEKAALTTWRSSSSLSLLTGRSTSPVASTVPHPSDGVAGDAEAMPTSVAHLPTHQPNSKSPNTPTITSATGSVPLSGSSEGCGRALLLVDIPLLVRVWSLFATSSAPRTDPFPFAAPPENSSSQLRGTARHPPEIITGGHLTAVQLCRLLRSVPSVLLRRDSAKDAELLGLRHENAVLRRKIGGPVRYEPSDRFWFAALSTPVPRYRWPTGFPVTPATPLDRHRRFIAAKWDYSARHRPTGRPTTRAAMKKLVLRLASESPPPGPPKNPRRTGPARPPHRRPHRLGHPARQRHRPRTPPIRTDLATISHHPSPRNHRR